MITYISVIENQSAKCEAYLWTGQRWKNPLPAIEIVQVMRGIQSLTFFSLIEEKNFVIYFV